MNILLIDPWVTDFTPPKKLTKSLGLMYVASFLRERGHSLRFINCLDLWQNKDVDNITALNTSSTFSNLSSYVTLCEKIEKPIPIKEHDFTFQRYGIPVDLFYALALEGAKPDIVLVTSGITYWYHGVFKAISILHKIFPSTPVVLGGIYARLCTDHAKQYSGADAVIAEYLPARIVKAVEAIGGKKGNGPLIGDHFSNWPDPFWNLYGRLSFIPMITSLGCPMRCTVCASHILCNNKYERKNPSNTVASILELKACGAKLIGFWDDALLMDADEYALPMFKELARLGAPVGILTPNSMHISKITPELSYFMKKGGVHNIALSIETTSKDRMHSFSNKASMDEFRKAVESLLDVGYLADQIRVYLLFGLPGQTIEEVLETKKFVSSFGAIPMVATFSPIPGTVEFNRAVKEGTIEKDADPVLHNNKLTLINLFNNNIDKQAKIKQLFNID